MVEAKSLGQIRTGHVSCQCDRAGPSASPSSVVCPVHSTRVKSSPIFCLVCGVALTLGCRDSAVTTKPAPSAMVGVWVPHEGRSTCPKTLISNDTRLLLSEDGTFVAEHFPKEVSLGGEPNVRGRWSLENERRRWNLALHWETPSKSILGGAELARDGRVILVEFWIGDPDNYSRLVLRKRGSITPLAKIIGANTCGLRPLPDRAR